MSLFQDLTIVLGDLAASFTNVAETCISVSGNQINKEIKKRLAECCDDHSSCPNLVDRNLPTRVIDVGQSGDEQVRLHITQLEEMGRYFALSYRWGGPQEVTTTNESLPDRTTGFPMAALPSTIQDAIKLTRDLGICRYLWIDALCIIQDNDEDKIYEINRMGAIYKNAVLTIAAANTHSAHDSFLADRPLPSTCTVPYLLPDDTYGKLWLRQDYSGWMLSPLDSRAWALQESLLSPRLLWYGPADLKWKCSTTAFAGVYRSHNYDFNYPANSHKRLPSSVFGLAEVPDTSTLEQQAKVWATVVGDYSGRDVTFAEDRLPALAGIASELQKVWKDGYSAGMWWGCLVRHLGWGNDADDMAPSQDADSVHLHLPTGGEYHSPGWSWASFPGKVSIWEEVVEPHAEVVDWQVTLVDENAPLSRVRDGKLVLRAGSIGEDQRLGMNKQDCWFKWDYNHCIQQDHISMTFRYALLGYSTGSKGIALVLAPVGDGTYMRIGVVFGFSTERWPPEVMEKRLITII